MSRLPDTSDFFALIRPLEPRPKFTAPYHDGPIKYQVKLHYQSLKALSIQVASVWDTYFATPIFANLITKSLNHKVFRYQATLRGFSFQQNVWYYYYINIHNFLYECSFIINKPNSYFKSKL